jgi:hypothetical protein
MKKIMLLCFATVLFSCGQGEEMKDYSTDKKANSDDAAENIAGGYAEEAPAEMNAEVVSGTVNKNELKKVYDEDLENTKDLLTEAEDVEMALPENKIDSRIIKKANMKFQVDNVDRSTRQIQRILKSKGAYVSDMNQSKNRNHFYSEITIRVPNQYFDAVLDQLATNDEKIDYKRISSLDVTEEYVDIQTRLKTKKEVKKRYEEILRNKAKTINEILNTEEKLRRLQEEIEAQEGRLRYLHNQTSMSTIYLTIYEEGVNLEEVKTDQEFSERANRGFSAGWGAVLNVVVALTYMWPAILITLFLLIWKRKFLLRIKKGITKILYPNDPNETQE